MKWALNFIGTIKPTKRLIGNKYILIVIDYAMKSIEAKALIINITVVTTRFLYEYILTIFGCPLTIVTNQGVHFINDTKKHLKKQFILKHVSSITYYPQGSGQVESINKVIGRLWTKLVNEKITNLHEHLSTILFSYKISYKVSTCYTPYQLIYGLHSLMPTKYVMSTISRDHKDAEPTIMLTTNFTKLEKLQENKLETQNNVGANQ